MNNRKYRVVCLLNALERRLNELRDKGASPQAIVDTLYIESLSIAAVTARADLRYVQGRLDYMLDTHCGDAGADDAKRRIRNTLSQSDRIGQQDLVAAHSMTA